MDGRFQEVLERQKMLWSLGNYNEVAKILMPAAGHVADACEIGASVSVLDVGAGTGNLAVEAATRGAAPVVATDLAPSQLELGKARTQVAGLDIEWREADAGNLPFEDGSFDVVGSVFGAMFAPVADEVVQEMLRVTKPGGVVGFTSWSADSYIGQTLRISSGYLPPPPEGANTPGEWGHAEEARSRFARHASDVEVRTGVVTWDFDSTDSARDFFETNAAPTIAAKMMLPPERFEELMSELEILQDKHNRGTGGRVIVDSEYLLLLARKPG